MAKVKISKEADRSTLAVANSLAWSPRSDCDIFEVVGDKLVSTDFMRILIDEIDGKISAFADVIDIRELLGVLYDGLGDAERDIVGACIVKLIEQNRVSLHPDSSVLRSAS